MSKLEGVTNDLKKEVEQIEKTRNTGATNSNVAALSERLVKIKQSLAVFAPEPNISRDTWKKIQIKLQVSPAKGYAGPLTRGAISHYQQNRSDHPPVTGKLTQEQLDDLLK